MRADTRTPRESGIIRYSVCKLFSSISALPPSRTPQLPTDDPDDHEAGLLPEGDGRPDAREGAGN